MQVYGRRDKLKFQHALFEDERSPRREKRGGMGGVQGSNLLCASVILKASQQAVEMVLRGEKR